MQERSVLDGRSQNEPGPNYQVKEVIVAGDRGPCGGVNMAIETTFDVLGIVAGSEPVFANNPPVHNDLILREFEKQGLLIQPEIREIPDGSILIASAHGWPPADKELASSKNLLVIDATCQLVTKVERAAERAILEGKHVIYVGADSHPEPRGVLGALPFGGYTFIDIDQPASVLPDQLTVFGKDGPSSIAAKLAQLVVLNQTTLSMIGIANKVKELREINPDIEIPDPEGICYATRNRQVQVRDRLFSLIEQPIQALVVVGSKSSSNSNELRNVGEYEAHIPSYLIDTPTEIPFNEFTPEIERILVTSGASVLDPYLQDVLEVLVSKGARLQFLRSSEKKPLVDPVNGRPLVNSITGELEYEERFFVSPSLDSVWRRYGQTNFAN